MIGKISFDLVMESDMDFAEGSFCVANGEWQVFIFSKGVQEDISIVTTK